MNFSEALIYLKQGRRVRRTVWSKKTYVVMMPGYNGPANMTTSTAHGLALNERVCVEPYFAIRKNNGGVTIWTATHVDLIHEDWVLFTDGTERQRILDLAPAVDPEPLDL